MTIPHPNPKEFPPEIFRLFDKYVHGIIDRRAFLVEAGRFAIGSLTAAGILDALSPRFAEARKVAPEDPGISAGFVQIDSPQGYGKVRGYLVKPAQPRGKRPVVLVVHENRGLNPHIEDIARRLAGTPDHRVVLPLATGAGALLMVWADTLARTALPDARELPVGLVTAFLGAPFFCYLLRRQSRIG